MNHNQRVGIFGEKLAREFLERRGHEIIGTNIRIRHKEIDIIAFKNSVLVFVEVKTRTSDKFGSAQEAIFSQKSKKLKKAIEIYLKIYEQKINFNDVRLDLISIDIQKQEKLAKIKHYKGIA